MLTVVNQNWNNCYNLKLWGTIIFRVSTSYCIRFIFFKKKCFSDINDDYGVSEIILFFIPCIKPNNFQKVLKSSYIISEQKIYYLNVTIHWSYGKE